MRTASAGPRRAEGHEANRTARTARAITLRPWSGATPSDASDPRDLRAANADREAYSDILETAYADGRLDSAGLEERSGRLWSATTIGELDELVQDLQPPETPLPAAMTPAGADRETSRGRGFGVRALVVGLAVTALIVVANVVRSVGGDGPTGVASELVGSDMYTADGIQQVVANFVAAAGTTQFVEIGFYGEYAIASAPGAPAAQRLARMDWRDGDVSLEPGQAVPEDVDAVLFDVTTDVDFAALAALALGAPEQTGMTEVDSLYMYVNRASFSGDHQIEARVNVSKDYQYASIVADHLGTVVTMEGPGVEPDPTRFLAAAGIEDALDAVVTRIGGPDIVEIGFYGEYVLTEAPPAPGAPVVAAFSYRGGTTAVKDLTIPSQPDDLATTLFSLEDVDPAVLATLVSEAPERVGVTDAESTYMYLERNLSRRNAPVEIVVYVSGPYDSGRIVADLTGRVLDVP